ncbi:MAG: hypothetical protein Q8R24_01155 [Legionellaceae bacterium]|nr:hypothetical protein [Legionellaceae bacterium]
MKPIPAYIAKWTDNFFHQSAYNQPVSFPNKYIINFLSRFKKTTSIQLYRGINKYNTENNLITSWTYKKDIAARYTGNKGKLVKKVFSPRNILLDTTTLNTKQKRQMGYDYKIDDKEVLIMNKIL